MTTSNRSTVPTHLAERDQTSLALVPQHEPHALETLQQGKPANAREVRVVAQHERQSVTGDSTTQMMNVVNPNVGGEPAQWAWQGIMRAAMKRRLLQIPSSVVSPGGILKLVLNIEQPDTGAGMDRCPPARSSWQREPRSQHWSPWR
jgi:hypothetical protein